MWHDDINIQPKKQRQYKRVRVGGRREGGWQKKLKGGGVSNIGGYHKMGGLETLCQL